MAEFFGSLNNLELDFGYWDWVAFGLYSLAFFAYFLFYYLQIGLSVGRAGVTMAWVFNKQFILQAMSGYGDEARVTFIQTLRNSMNALSFLAGSSVAVGFTIVNSLIVELLDDSVRFKLALIAMLFLLSFLAQINAMRSIHHLGYLLPLRVEREGDEDSGMFKPDKTAARNLAEAPVRAFFGLVPAQWLAEAEAARVRRSHPLEAASLSLIWKIFIYWNLGFRFYFMIPPLAFWLIAPGLFLISTVVTITLLIFRDFLNII